MNTNRTSLSARRPVRPLTPAQAAAAFPDLGRTTAARRARITARFHRQAEALLRSMGCDRPSTTTTVRTLVASMSSPAVHYHTLVHVLWAIDQARVIGARLEPWQELGLYFHDAVYHPTAKSPANEIASAQFLRALLTGTGIASDDLDRAEEFILATARHLDAKHPDHLALPLDLDLSGLAAEPVMFAQQSKLVAAEYAHLPKGDYARGRIAFFTRLMARPLLYTSAAFRARPAIEARARANIAAEIARFGG